jgi:hypothetical protein
MSYCTAAVFRDKLCMYMNDACAPFMYLYTQFMYICKSCFQGTPTMEICSKKDRTSNGNLEVSGEKIHQ